MEQYVESLRQRAQEVQKRIDEACHRAGRSPDEVQLIWVSKTHPIESVEAAIQAGARHFGENRVQELEEKFSQPRSGVTRHLIGPVQSNKLRKAIAHADLIHTISSLKQIERCEQLAQEFDRRISLLFQVNTSREESKSGLSLEELEPFLQSLPETSRLLYSGLMTIGPNTGNPEDARSGFRTLREIRDLWKGRDSRFDNFTQLSFGMSDDLEVAVEEGATWVRIGTALFGAREYRWN